jgi:hypothetical protein
VPRAVLLGLEVHTRLDRRLAATLRDESLLDRREDLGVAQSERLDIGVVEVAEVDLARALPHVNGPASADSAPARARTRSLPRSRRRRGA